MRRQRPVLFRAFSASLPLLILAVGAAGHAADLLAVRLVPSEDSTRLVLELDEPAPYWIEDPWPESAPVAFTVRLAAQKRISSLPSGQGVVSFLSIASRGDDSVVGVNVGDRLVRIEHERLDDPPRIFVDLRPAGVAVPAVSRAEAAAPDREATPTASSAEPPRATLIRTRVGAHERFTRVVFDLDRDAKYVLDVPPRGEGSDEVLVLLDAETRAPPTSAPAGLVASVAIQNRGDRSVARLRVSELPVHVESQVLSDPPRVVVDLHSSPPGGEHGPRTSPVAAGPPPEPVAAVSEMPSLPIGARLVDARVGAHPTFTRVVFELTGGAPFRIDQVADGASTALLVELAAESPERSVAARGLVGDIRVEPRGAGTLAHIPIRGTPVEVTDFVLDDPPRIVLDVRPARIAGSSAATLPPVTLLEATRTAPRPEAPMPPLPEVASGPSGAPVAPVPTPGSESAAGATSETRGLPEATRADGPVYRVSRFRGLYADPNPAFPPIEEVFDTEIELGQASTGFVTPRPPFPVVRRALSEFTGGSVQFFHASAVRSVNQQLVHEFNRRDFHAIVVMPVPEQIQRRTGRDLRPQGQTDLDLAVYAGRVQSLSTFASGDRFGDEARQDNPAHAHIRERSPVRPDGPDLVRKDQIEAYAARLNRHPGRRVDASISPGRQPGTVNLDYMVHEAKPWYAYVQAGNIGTEETTDWRQRFGFVHTQLTGRDDVLTLDYVTGDFDEVNAVLGSYEAPFFGTDWLRWRIHAAWSEYDASVLGFPGVLFTGEQWGSGAELFATVFQDRDFFLDLVLGMRYEDIEVDNQLIRQRGEDDFLLPMVGLRFQRDTDVSRLFAALSFETNWASLAGTSKTDSLKLGRIPVDEDFSILRWDASTSFYLEPLLLGESWRDPQTPRTSTLAHEFFLGFRGQYSLGDRLIPQEQRIAGGFHTVRGYPQAAAVGDTVILGRAEYRFHLPRILSPQAEPVQVPLVGAFRLAPQYVYTEPDWDLVFRLFADYGRTIQADRTSFEQNETLLGIGAGLELQIRQNLTLRFDVGQPLKPLDSPRVRTGGHEYYFVGTLLY